MQAAVFTQYGPPEVLQLKTVAQPAPKAGEILIKVQAVTVNSADSRLRRADPFAVRLFFGLFRPKKNILGHVFSGEIVAVGASASRFKPGDTVFGTTSMRLGAFAEYLCLPEKAPLALKPENLSHAEAAALPFGGLTAWHFLQKAAIQPGQKVLIYGASGAVGTAAVQLAKQLGAEVTGVCSASNMDLVRSLGAEHVIDYAKTDFSAVGPSYNVVFETVNKAPVAACLAALKPKGMLILGAAMLKESLQGAWAAMTTDKKVLFGVATEMPEDLLYLKRMAESGVLKAVIDRTYPLAQIVAAHRYVDGGHKKGNVVILM
jgi:NADPH:quinone reductase-like Zn-dependent oxidoreductase